MKRGVLPFQYEQEKTSTGMTALGGLPAYLELVQVAGLSESVERHVRVREGGQGWSDGQVITPLIMLNLAGGEAVDDLRVLEKDGGFCRVLRRAETYGMRRRERRALEGRWRKERRRSVPSPSAVFRYLGGVHDEGEENRREVHRAFIPAPNKVLLGLVKVNSDLLSFVQRCRPQKVATLDMDATLVGAQKRDALYSYRGYKAYQPLTTYWAEQEAIVHSEFRDGNVPAGHEQLRVLKEFLGMLPSGVDKVSTQTLRPPPAELRVTQGIPRSLPVVWTKERRCGKMGRVKRAAEISTEGGNMRLQGKVAIITGAASGLGAEDARLFAREGASVVIADILEAEGKQVEAEVSEAGKPAMFARIDVTSDEDWRRLVQATVSRFGKLDILVNNAGISSGSYLDTMDPEGWRRIMEVNATSVFLGTKYAIPEMKKAGGGSIVNISSIMGFVGSEGGHPAYHASKGAVRIFTKATAVRYGPDGIRANSVHPGFMPPMRSPRHSNRSDRSEQIRVTPLRRTGETVEVAYGVLFLASDEASFITGTELVIDGGFIAR